MYLKENRMVWIPAVFGLLILIYGSIACVSASPQLPCEFYGTVSISGSPAPVGTEITAYVNSVQQGKIVVKETGKYGGTGTFDERLIVLAGENDFTGGAPTITFKIGDKVADQTAPYAPGMSKELSMSSGGGAAAAAASVPAANSSGSTGAMQISSIESASAAPVVPVITAAPVVPVITVAGPAPVVTSAVPQSTSPVMNGTPAVTANQTASPVAPNATPVVPVVNATPVPTVIPVPVNQTGMNISNVTVVPVNATPSVSFPSGQTITP